MSTSPSPYSPYVPESICQALHDPSIPTGGHGFSPACTYLGGRRWRVHCPNKHSREQTIKELSNLGWKTAEESEPPFSLSIELPSQPKPSEPALWPKHRNRILSAKEYQEQLDQARSARMTALRDTFMPCASELFRSSSWWPVSTTDMFDERQSFVQELVEKGHRPEVMNGCDGYWGLDLKVFPADPSCSMDLDIAPLQEREILEAIPKNARRRLCLENLFHTCIFALAEARRNKRPSARVALDSSYYKLPIPELKVLLKRRGLQVKTQQQDDLIIIELQCAASAQGSTTHPHPLQSQR